MPRNTGRPSLRTDGRKCWAVHVVAGRGHDVGPVRLDVGQVSEIRACRSVAGDHWSEPAPRPGAASTNVRHVAGAPSPRCCGVSRPDWALRTSSKCCTGRAAGGRVVGHCVAHGGNPGQPTQGPWIHVRIDDRSTRALAVRALVLVTPPRLCTWPSARQRPACAPTREDDGQRVANQAPPAKRSSPDARPRIRASVARNSSLMNRWFRDRPQMRRFCAHGHALGNTQLNRPRRGSHRRSWDNARADPAIRSTPETTQIVAGCGEVRRRSDAPLCRKERPPRV